MLLHQLACLRYIVRWPAVDELTRHASLRVFAVGSTLGYRSDDDVTVGQRADRMRVFVLHRQESDALVTHLLSCLAQGSLAGYAFEIGLHEFTASHLGAPGWLRTLGLGTTTPWSASSIDINDLTAASAELLRATHVDTM